jgi:hypothetical protein
VELGVADGNQIARAQTVRRDGGAVATPGKYLPWRHQIDEFESVRVPSHDRVVGSDAVAFADDGRHTTDLAPKESTPSRSGIPVSPAAVSKRRRALARDGVDSIARDSSRGATQGFGEGRGVRDGDGVGHQVGEVPPARATPTTGGRRR